jgi:hypothetical protein
MVYLQVEIVNGMGVKRKYPCRDSNPGTRFRKLGAATPFREFLAGF